jgi:hypothetical protein
VAGVAARGPRVLTRRRTPLYFSFPVDLFAELKQLIQTLEGRSVDYALCGGVALAIHGAPRAGRQSAEFEGGRIRVVSREGLIALKLAAGRPQDIADVQRLEEVGRG